MEKLDTCIDFSRLRRGLLGLFKALDSRYRRSLRGLLKGCLVRACVVELYLLAVTGTAEARLENSKIQWIDLRIEAYIRALEAL